MPEETATTTIFKFDFSDLPPVPPGIPSVKKEITPEQIKKERGSLSTITALLLNGLTFGIYDPKFTEEEKRKHPILFSKIPLKEKVLDKIPVVNWLADALLPYDVSLASVLAFLPLGAAIRGFSSVGKTILKTLRLEQPVLKTTTAISRKAIQRLLPKAEPKLVKMKSAEWGERMANEVALGWGLAVGHSLKSFWEESKKEKPNYVKPLLELGIGLPINSIAFPLVSAVFEGARVGWGRISSKLFKRGEEPVLTEAEKKITEPGVKLLNEAIDRSEQELTYQLFKLSDKEFLAKILSPEIVQKIGLDKLSFVHLKRINDIARPDVRLIVENYLKLGVFPHGIPPEAQEKISKIAQSIKSHTQQAISREVKVVDDILSRLKKGEAWKKLIVPEEVRRKPIEELTPQEKDLLLDAINLLVKNRQIEIKDLDTLKFFAENPSLIDRTRNALEDAIRKVLTEINNTWTPEMKAEFVKQVFPEALRVRFQLYNEWFKANRDRLPPELLERFDKAENILYERFGEKIGENVFNEVLSLYLKQYNAVFNTADKGEGLINFIKAINKSSNSETVVKTLNEGFRAASRSETKEYLIKYNKLLEDPFTELVGKIERGALDSKQLPEAITTEDLSKKIAEELRKAQENPVDFVQARILNDKDYDIWDLAADVYQLQGLERNTVVDAFMEFQRAGKLKGDHKKILKNVFNFFVGKFHPTAKIKHLTKDPVSRLTLLKEELEKEALAHRAYIEPFFPFQKETAHETAASAIMATETFQEVVQERVIEKTISSEIKEKIPSQILKIYAESFDKDSFVKEIDNKWLNDELNEMFVVGGKYGLPKEPKIGDKFKLWTLFSEKGEEFKVVKITKGITKTEYLLENSKNQRITLTAEQIGFLSLLGDEGGLSVGEALWNLLNKNSKILPQKKEVITAAKKISPSQLAAEREIARERLVEAIRKNPRLDEELAKISTLLELAEPGRRYKVEGLHPWEEEWIGQPSTFPDWIPEHLRSRKVIDDTLPYLDIRNLSIPKTKRARELFWLALEEAAKNAKVDISDLIGVLQSLYEK